MIIRRKDTARKITWLESAILRDPFENAEMVGRACDEWFVRTFRAKPRTEKFIFGRGFKGHERDDS